MVLTATALLASCGAGAKNSDEKTDEAEKKECEQTAPNSLTKKEKEEGWKLLFDGETSEGWRGYNKDSFPAGWEIVDGTIHCHESGRGEAGGEKGGDIIYDEKFKNFELKLEWKISEGGNSGIFYLAEEVEGQPIWQSAPEMQILDNTEHPDGRDSIHSAGALYDMIGVGKDKVKPVGEWNKVKLLVYDGLVEHWLNGEKVVEYHLWTPEWEEMVANSKFPKYNEDWVNVAEEGYIGLQDHGNAVWFRNIKIKKY